MLFFSNITSPPLTFRSDPTFIYNINSQATCKEVQQKYNHKLPFPLTSPSSNTPSSSHSSPLPTASSNSNSPSTSLKKSTCFNFFKFLKKLKLKFQCKSSLPQATIAMSSTFDYKHQFENIFQLEDWNIKVPTFLVLLAIFFKDQKFIQQKGIFWLSANVENLNQFINKFKNINKNGIQELNLNLHLLTQFHLEPCDAFKRWLRELPEKCSTLQ